MTLPKKGGLDTEKVASDLALGLSPSPWRDLPDNPFFQPKETESDKKREMRALHPSRSGHFGGDGCKKKKCSV